MQRTHSYPARPVRVREAVGLSRWRGFLVFLLLAMAAPIPAWAAIGFVAAVDGRVDLLRQGEAVWSAARLDADIEVGDTLRTGLNSAVKVVLVDDTVLGLGEDTELVIDNLVIGPEALTEPSVLRQLRGQVRTRVGEAFGGTTRIEIHTPTAIMGVKGTEGTTRVDGLLPSADPSGVDGPASRPEEAGGQEISTLVRNWEGGITAAMLEGAHVDVPPGQCRIVYRDRMGEAAQCPDDFAPVRSPGPPPSDWAHVQADLLVGDGLPPVSAGIDALDVGDAVGSALLIEPPDPVLEDRTDADAFAGEDFDPFAGVDFGGMPGGSDPP